MVELDQFPLQDNRQTISNPVFGALNSKCDYAAVDIGTDDYESPGW